MAIFSCGTRNKAAKSATYQTDLFSTLVSAEYFGRETETNLVIQTQADLKSLYQSVGKEDAPMVDFSKSKVIALFLGTKNTGGYSVLVDRVEEEQGKLVVYKKVTRPEGMATMAITNPFVIVEIYSLKPIVFK